MTRRELLLLLALPAASCARKPGGAASVTDAHRVVSVAPSTTEALFAIGAGDRVVGRSRYYDWPPEAAKLPAVAGFASADVESILALGPDLVVGTPGPSASKLAEQLGARGVATWFPVFDSCASIRTMILGMGARTHHDADARRVADAIDQRLRDVQRAVAGEAVPRVLLVVALTPIVAAGPGSFLDELLERARAVNVVRAGGAWAKLGLEQIVDLDPEVVVDGSSDPGAPSRIAKDAPGWRDVRAVETGRVVALGDARILRPGPRVAEGLALLAHALHPAASLPPPLPPSGDR